MLQWPAKEPAKETANETANETAKETEEELERGIPMIRTRSLYEILLQYCAVASVHT